MLKYFLGGFLMKNKKININGKNEDLKEIKTLIIITLIIVVIAIGLYFLTEVALKKKNAPAPLPEPSINYSLTMIGEVFDQPYDEYYVFIYSSKDKNAGQYSTLISNHNKKESPVKLFYADLNSGFNRFAISETANPKPTKASEVAVKDVALMIIKGGKVTKYYETIEDFEKVLN